MTKRKTKHPGEQGRLLVVDDEAVIRKALSIYLEREGYEVVLASDGKEGLARFSEGGIDLSLIDLMMPEVSGHDVVKAMRKKDPDALAIIMTAYGTIPSAVDAIRSGAYYYVTKPFELDEIGTLVRKALEYRRVVEENVELRRKLEQRERFDKFIGQSPQIRQVFKVIEKVAETDSTVLLLGESGTGKELVARAIHEQSSRRDKSLVAVNCAAMPEGLLESEFFGHVRGAFTGAAANRDGKFAQADGGTIFLDEIADMSSKLQVKILRVLQERHFEPVGSNEVREVDVRVIAATNRNLEQLVEEGKFREDLYYRLNVIPIEVPPLRKRRSDIPLLMDYFLKRISGQNNVELVEVSPEVKKCLLDYSWPGNVRELENMMERLIVLNRGGMIVAEDLPPTFRDGDASASVFNVEIPDSGVSFKELVGTYERDLIRSALNKTSWNKNRAANLLGLNRTTLIEKIKKQGIDKSE
jgi:DNA-binding NtrC family response regulator